MRGALAISNFASSLRRQYSAVISTTCSKLPRLFFKPCRDRWRCPKRLVNADEIVNAEVKRDGQLVRFQVFAVAEPLALIPLQFLANGQKGPLDVRRVVRLSKSGEPTTALRSAVCILRTPFIVPQACQRAGPAEFWQSFGLEGVILGENAASRLSLPPQ